MSVIEVPAHVYPNLTQTAEIIGVSKSTLSRNHGADAEVAGLREKRFSPTDVLRLAEFYKRVSINEVARDILEHVRHADSAFGVAVEEEIEAYFASRKRSLSGKDAFFADLERVLPPELYRTVRDAYLASEGLEPPDVVADITDDEIEEFGL